MHMENAKYLKEKINLKKTNKIEELILFDFKTYCEAMKGVEQNREIKNRPNMYDDFVSGKDFFIRSEITLKIK